MGSVRGDRRTPERGPDPSRPLALVEAVGQVVFEHRAGDPEAGLDLVFERLAAEMSLLAAAVVRPVASGDLEVVAAWMPGGTVVDRSGMVLPRAELPGGLALESLRAPTVFGSDEFGPAYSGLLANVGGQTSLLGIPVVVSGEVEAALILLDGSGRRWEADPMVALTVVAKSVWGFLGRCGIETDLRDRVGAAELLADFGRRLNLGGRGVPIEVLGDVTAAIARFTSARRIVHYEFRDECAVPFLCWGREHGFTDQPDHDPIPVDSDRWTALSDHRLVSFGPGTDAPVPEIVPPGCSGMLAAGLVGANVVGVVLILMDDGACPSAAHRDLVGGVVDLFGQFRARTRTERALARRRRVDEVRSQIAESFVESASTGAVRSAVNEALRMLADLFGAGSATWIDLDVGAATGTIAAVWAVDEVEGGVGTVFPLDLDRIRLDEVTVMTVDDVAHATGRSSVSSNLIVPTALGSDVVGALTLRADGDSASLPRHEVDMLVDVGRLIHQVRDRARQAAASLRREELDDLQLALASRFLEAPAGADDTVRDRALADLAAGLGVEAAAVVEVGADGVPIRHVWVSGPDSERFFEVFADERAHGEFWRGFVQNGEPFLIGYDDLPEHTIRQLDEMQVAEFTMVATPRRGSEADLALVLYSFDDREWSADEMAAMRHVAGQFRQFLDAASSRREIERRLALDGLVTSASARLVESADPDTETRHAMQQIGEFFDAVTVVWTDVDHHARRLVASHLWLSANVVDDVDPTQVVTLEPETWDATLLPITHPLVVDGAGLVAELREVSPDTVDLVNVVVPVVVRGRPEALLVIQTDADLHWSEKEMSALTSLATVVHEVLDRARADRLFSITFRSAPTGQLLVTSSGELVAANESFEALVGGPCAGRPLSDFFPGAQVPSELVAGETRLEASDAARWVRVRTAEVSLVHEVEPVTVVHVEDATAERRNRERLRWEATHDELTGLANRRVLSEELEASIADGRPCAVLMVDIDRFKVVNDSLGHTAGDAVLQRIAERLRRSLRNDDMVCRFGGDEFAVLVRDEVGDHALAEIARRAIDLLRLPVDLDGTVIIPTCSVGIAVLRSGDDVEAVMRHADAALYEAKALGRDRYEFFDESRRDLLQDRLRLETSIRQGLLQREFVPWYQPEHDIVTGEITAVEALVRWNHPTRGLLAAGEFIDVAEEMGVAPQMSASVLDRAMAAASAWRDAGHPIRVRVNVAAGQLQSAELHAQLRAGLDHWDLPPELLCLEITERSLMLDVDSGVATIAQVRAMGIEVAIDDFGTGFSSLARLKDLPVDILKIDRSFISGVVDSATDREIVRTIVGLGNGLGLGVVAEGVETAAQAEVLRDLGCTRAQGWYWSLARPGDDISDLLSVGARRR